MVRVSGILGWVSFILVLVGGINWGLWGIFHFNLVDIILGDFSLLSRLVYVLVGAGAGYLIYMLVKQRKMVA